MNINKLVSILLVRKKKIMILLEVSVGRGRAPGVGPRIRGFLLCPPSPANCSP